MAESARRGYSALIAERTSLFGSPSSIAEMSMYHNFKSHPDAAAFLWVAALPVGEKGLRKVCPEFGEWCLESAMYGNQNHRHGSDLGHPKSQKNYDTVSHHPPSDITRPGRGGAHTLRLAEPLPKSRAPSKISSPFSVGAPHPGGLAQVGAGRAPRGGLVGGSPRIQGGAHKRGGGSDHSPGTAWQSQVPHRTRPGGAWHFLAGWIRRPEGGGERPPLEVVSLQRVPMLKRRLPFGKKQKHGHPIRAKRRRRQCQEGRARKVQRRGTGVACYGMVLRPPPVLVPPRSGKALLLPGPSSRSTWCMVMVPQPPRFWKSIETSKNLSHSLVAVLRGIGAAVTPLIGAHTTAA
jgi:hypothetical protein